MTQNTSFVPIGFFSREYFFKKFFPNPVTMPTMPTMLYYCYFKPFLVSNFVTNSCYSMLQSIKKPRRVHGKLFLEKRSLGKNPMGC